MLANNNNNTDLLFHVALQRPLGCIYFLCLSGVIQGGCEPGASSGAGDHWVTRSHKGPHRKMEGVLWWSPTPYAEVSGPIVFGGHFEKVRGD